MPDRSLKILSVFGTRPEAVKMAPVVKRLRQTEGVESSVCVTAQHRQMLDQVLDLFDIQPDFDLDIMRPDQTLSESMAAMLTRLEPVLESSQPDWVLVQGDTSTVVAAGLLAYYHRLRVGHIEAGLRTGDKWQPFPEEINRKIAGVVADLHFAPTQQARLNLLQEGRSEDDIVVTGNPVIDALNYILTLDYDLYQGPLHGIDPTRRIALVTAHRRENFGRPLQHIFTALRRLAERYADQVEFIYPVHMNPNVYGPAHEHLSGLYNLHLLEPLDYLPMAHLMRKADLILTDSGGLQEEGPAVGTPVLVMRAVTERPEAVEAGVARLVGTDVNTIVEQASRLLDDPAAHAEMAQAANPFGDGHAAERIVKAILDRSREAE
ncbi:MAG: UDP-N-acetylglucosamine 2-epimerase (non-hydrolyzing) [Anaerolineales bacterium]|jgi:UDP-N-acetylglucosamine 2-epimerase (non-hydrolysing)